MTQFASINIGEDSSKLKPYTIPIFVPLISVVQVIIHYYKTPHFLLSYLQFNPARRYEVWRYLTPALIHAGRGDLESDPNDQHWWTNIILQMWFGWWIEKILEFKRTGILYTSCIFFGTLILSATNPFLTLSGASAAVCGLFAANLGGHILMRKRQNDLCWKSMWIYLIILIAQTKESLDDPNQFGDLKVGHFAHLGGALGGLLIGVILWPVRTSRWNGILRISACVISMLTLTVGVVVNIRYAQMMQGLRIEVENGHTSFYYRESLNEDLSYHLKKFG